MPVTDPFRKSMPHFSTLPKPTQLLNRIYHAWCIYISGLGIKMPKTDKMGKRKAKGGEYRNALRFSAASIII
jgi:hypothetical protein